MFIEKIYIKFKLYKIPGIKFLKIIYFKLFKNKKSLTRSYLLQNEPPFRKSDLNALKSMKNIFQNQECLIIGNGPSINNIDFSKFGNIPSFAVNSFYLKTIENNYYPTFFTIEDKHVFADSINKIKNYNVMHKFIPNLYRNKFFDNNSPEFIYYVVNFDFYKGKEIKFSRNVENTIFAGGSVTYINLQLAHFFGFKTVYLIGMDFNYIKPQGTLVDGNTWVSTGDDPNHFSKDYFGEGKRYHDPQLDRAKIAYQKAEDEFKKDGKKILNLTAETKLDVFEKAKFEKYF